MAEYGISDPPFVLLAYIAGLIFGREKREKATGGGLIGRIWAFTQRAILVIGPVIVFTIYLREMIRRIREHDLGSKPSPEEEGSRGKER